MSKFQHHTKLYSKCIISLVSSLTLRSVAGGKSLHLVVLCFCHSNHEFKSRVHLASSVIQNSGKILESPVVLDLSKSVLGMAVLTLKVISRSNLTLILLMWRIW